MKKKSRWRRAVLWSSVGLTILLIATAFIANYAVDKVLRSMSGMDTILNEVEADDSADDTLGKGAVGSDVDVPDDMDTPGITDQPDDEQKLATDDEQKLATDDAKSNNDSHESNSKSDGDSDDEEPTYRAEISTDKAKKIEENATIGEKATVASLLMKNLNASDIKLLTDLASGGLNLEEKKEARSLILEKLSEEEYNKLIQIAQKYGVSQGKPYNEVIKEE